VRDVFATPPANEINRLHRPFEHGLSPVRSRAKVIIAPRQSDLTAHLGEPLRDGARSMTRRPAPAGGRSTPSARPPAVPRFVGRESTTPCRVLRHQPVRTATRQQRESPLVDRASLVSAAADIAGGKNRASANGVAPARHALAPEPCAAELLFELVPGGADKLAGFPWRRFRRMALGVVFGSLRGGSPHRNRLSLFWHPHRDACYECSKRVRSIVPSRQKRRSMIGERQITCRSTTQKRLHSASPAA